MLSTGVVALAEMGDKTQLLALLLAARLKKPAPIVSGIAVATLVNHALAAALGAWLATLAAPQTLQWIVAAAFFAFAVWALVPDRLHAAQPLRGGSVFLVALVAFFLVEMGDKTQLATVALAVRYEALVAVVAGSTLGMLVANAPVVWFGERLARRLPMRALRWAAAALFVALGVLTLLA